MKTGGCIIHKITRSEEYQKREVGARGELDCESRHSWPHSGDARTYTFEIEAWAGPLPTRLLKENPRHITTLSLSETWCACLWGHASYAITFGISINVPVSIVCVFSCKLQITKELDWIISAWQRESRNGHPGPPFYTVQQWSSGPVRFRRQVCTHLQLCGAVHTCQVRAATNIGT